MSSGLSLPISHGLSEVLKYQDKKGRQRPAWLIEPQMLVKLD